MAKVKNTNNKNERVITGRNVYRDKYNTVIYYDPRKKIGYKIPKEEEANFQSLTRRYILGLIAFILVQYAFVNNLFISIPFGIGVALFMEYRFRKLLGRCALVTNFTPSSNKKSADTLMETELSGLYLRLIMYLALAILLILNIFATKSVRIDYILIVSSIAAALWSFYQAFKFLNAIIKKRNK